MPNVQLSPNARRGLGAPAMPPIASPNGTPWTALPGGHPIPVRNGYAYYMIASVKTSHDQAAIKDWMGADKWDWLSYSEAPANGNYRLVTAVVRAKKDASDMPWGAPSVAFWDDTTVVSGWYSPPAGKGALPATESDTDTGTLTLVGIGVVGVVGATGFFGWRWWKNRKARST